MRKFFVWATMIAACTPAYAKEMPEHLELKTETVNAVLQYLSQQPYAETAKLIQRIQQESNVYLKRVSAKQKETQKEEVEENAPEKADSE